jgi:hypothetical protein
MDRLTTRGLAGIEADDTALSHVEGTRGRLAYRGYPIEELTSLPFEAVLWLLLEGELPTESELEAFSGWLIEVGELTAADRALIDAAKVPRHASMTLVQGLLPLLDTTGPDAPLPGFGDLSIARVFSVSEAELLERSATLSLTLFDSCFLIVLGILTCCSVGSTGFGFGFVGAGGFGSGSGFGFSGFLTSSSSPSAKISS